MDSPDAGMTDRFAEFVGAFPYERIPVPVVERTKEILYDGLGALLAATSPRYDIGAVLRRRLPGPSGQRRRSKGSA
jgi:hypothetical protein